MMEANREKIGKKKKRGKKRINKNKIKLINKELYPNCNVGIWLRSCLKETTEPIDGEIIGTIPKWLKGSLLRNGPGSLKVGSLEFNHLFDASALLHRFCIKDGRVTYQNRFIRSRTYKRNEAAKRIVVTEFGTDSVPDPCQTIFQRISAIFNPEDCISDNPLISIYPFNDEFYAFTESPVIHRINPKTLETEERISVSKYIGIVNHSAHPHVLPDGTFYNLGLSAGISGLKYNIVEFLPSQSSDRRSSFEKARVVGSVPVRWSFSPAYMHSFGITDSFFVIIEQPLSISVARLMRNFFCNKAFISSLKWYQEEPTNIHLIHRSTGKLFRTFVSKAFFYLHVINQYETSKEVVLDICCYDDPSIIEGMYVENLRNAQRIPEYAKMFRGRPIRFRLPISDPTNKEMKKQAIRVESEMLCNLGCETPRINYSRCLGKFYRYFYGISSDVDAENPGIIIKIDTWEKKPNIWGEKGVYPSEPVFIASPNSKAEDDGILLSAIVWASNENMSGLLILNAQSMKEIGRAIFHTESSVPKCLHGWFAENIV